MFVRLPEALDFRFDVGHERQESVQRAFELRLVDDMQAQACRGSDAGTGQCADDARVTLDTPSQEIRCRISPVKRSVEVVNIHAHKYSESGRRASNGMKTASFEQMKRGAPNFEIDDNDDLYVSILIIVLAYMNRCGKVRAMQVLKGHIEFAWTQQPPMSRRNDAFTSIYYYRYL